MNAASSRLTTLAIGLLLAIAPSGLADEPAELPKAFVDGRGPGWKELGEADFTRANCDPETWTWKGNVVHCNGQPVGVLRTNEQLGNFELVAEWCHLKSAWGTRASSSGAHRPPSTASSPTFCRAGGSRCRYSTTATPSSSKRRPARRPTGSPPTATSSPSARRR